MRYAGKVNTVNHFSDYKIKKIIEAFCADISATQASILLYRFKNKFGILTTDKKAPAWSLP